MAIAKCYNDSNELVSEVYWENERVEIGKQSSLKQKWEYPLRVQVSLFVILIQN
jgi:hypothetical protein